MLQKLYERRRRLTFALLALLALSVGLLAAATTTVNVIPLTALSAAAIANNADLLYMLQGGGDTKVTVGLIRAGLTPTSRTLTTTAPLKIGGGSSANLSVDRTLSVDDADASNKGVVKLAGQLSGTAASPTVVGLRESGGPTNLSIGAIADGQRLVRSGSTVVGETRTYDVDRQPASCAACDSWPSNSAQLSWAWGHQNGASETLEMEGMTLAGPGTGSDTISARGTATPSSGSVDFTITAKIVNYQTGSNDGCGIGVIDGGSLGSPSKIYYTGNYGTVFLFQFATDYLDGGIGNVWGSFPTGAELSYGRKEYFQLRYTASSKRLEAWFGYDHAKVWTEPGGTSAATLTNAPTQMFAFVRRAGKCHVEWFAARTDSNRDQAGE